MQLRRTMKRLTKAVLLALFGFFIVATHRFIELVLTNLTYHPWLTSIVLIALLAMVIWLLYEAYNGEPESVQG